MNKMIKGFLAIAFIVGSASATTNKTFLMPRSQGVNAAMEYAGYNELINHKNGDFFGANFQVVPFYMESNDSVGLGKYFGIKDKNLISLKSNGNGDFNNLYMIHDQADAAADHQLGVGSVKYEPKLEAYGARIDYFQDLEKVLDGLYLKVALPIVHVENDMHIKTAVTHDGTAEYFTADNLAAYFKGNYEKAAGDVNAQAKLNRAKINGSQSETSVADIDVILGYKIFDKDKYNVSLNLGLTIPVGNDSDGVWAFEPIVGNGNHWALGGGLDACVSLWEDGDQNIKLTTAANYRYLFESTEKRTLGLINEAGNKVDWGQYYLVGLIDQVRGTQQLTPFANDGIGTVNMNIEPGSQLDAIAYLTYNNGGWNIDLGYNFFWKEKEDANLKTAWTDGKYGIAIVGQTMAQNDGNPNFEYTNGNAVGDNAVGGALALVNATYSAADHAYGIDTSAAETPSIDTHKVFGNVGYIFNDWEYPVMLGFGGAYEFADQKGLENWQVFGKVGIKF